MLPYWPRLLFIAGGARATPSPVRAPFTAGGGEEPELNDEPVFVLGHPRTGTTHLHNLLSKDERFAFATTFSVGFPSSFCASAGCPADHRPSHGRHAPHGQHGALAWDTPQEDELATNQMSSGTSPYAPLLFPRKEKAFRPFYRFLLAASGDGGDGDGEPAHPEDFERWRRAFVLFLKKTQYAAGGAHKRLLLKSPVHTARVRLIRRRCSPRRRSCSSTDTRSRCSSPAAHMADAYYTSVTCRSPPCWTCRSSSCTRARCCTGRTGKTWRRCGRRSGRAANRKKWAEARARRRRFSDLDVDPVGTLRSDVAPLGWAEAFEKVEPAIERWYKLSLVDFKKNAFGKRALSSEAEAAKVRHRWRAWFEDLGYE